VQFVKACTRGRGFGDDEVAQDLASVIITAAARLLTNPEATDRQTIGQYGATYGLGHGWSLPELAVLHRYRRRMA
jgi:hypothetical protein